MINVDIGTLDKRVALVAYESYKDDHGLTKQLLVERIRTWARIEPTRGNELREQYKETVTDLVKITIRYRSGVANDMFVRYGETTYKIQYVVDPYMAHVKLELMCTLKTVGDDRDGP
ncbi:phage head closure protein [uncultured Megasphaera sp.]|uniref:phage head closure protein n=1 Tax=uncultured Megasphaera sp. TaxID=165188 RepID=UPI0026586278|nr:phage head closure protein [uncultured Megasphaera sp.]